MHVQVTNLKIEAGSVRVSYTLVFPADAEPAAIAATINQLVSDPGAVLSAKFIKDTGPMTVTVENAESAAGVETLKKEDGLNEVAIAGIVIGSIAGTVITAAVFFIVIHKRRRRFATVVPRDVEIYTE